MRNIGKGVLIAVLVWNAIAVIRAIGEPRQPITTQVAAVVVVFNGLVVWFVASL